MKKIYSRFVSKKVLIVLLSFICVGRLWAQTYIPAETISGDSTWTKAKSPYVLQGTVVVTGTLTIEAGVTVKITTGAIQLKVQGNLVANGQMGGDSIFFKRPNSLRGDQIQPISLEASSTSSLQYVTIDSLGYYNNDDETNKCALIVKSSNCQISHCTLQNTWGTALSIVEGAKPRVNDCVFLNNDKATIDLDLVCHPDELVNITENNALRIGLRNIVVSVSTNDTLKEENTSYRLLTNVSIPSGKTLVVNPGATVKIDAGNIRLSISGTLLAIGLNNKKINLTRFGSARGDQIAPIVFETTSQNSVLRNIIIDNLGYYNDDNDLKAIIFIRSLISCTIDSCSLSNIAGSAILIGKSAKPKITNSSFSSSISRLDVVLDPDKIRNLVNNNTSLGGLRIGLTDSISMGLNDTLYSYNQFYRLLNKQVIVPKTKILMLEEGTKVQIPTGVYQLMVQGTLIANGTSSNNAQISPYGSYRGDQIIPIYFDTSSLNSVLHFTSIDGFGYYNNDNTKAVLSVNSSSFTFVNSIVQNTQGVGVQITNSASPRFLQSCFYSSTNGAVLSLSGQANFKYCNFIGNTSGIKNISLTDIITADSCYWGDASGPLQSSTNPTAVGDSVSIGVTYMPYTQDPYDCNYDVLPLTLLNFETTLYNNTVNCTWQTANETNTSYFIIQRSIDGTNFTTLGKVYASGNSTTNKSYSFTDKSPNNGINYYRLQMVDKDGKYSYSKTLPINISIKQPFAIYPNPVKEVLYAQIQRNMAEKVSLQIVDMQGKLILQQSQQLAAGITTVSVNTTALAKGSYFVIIKGQTTEKKIFIKE